MATQCTTIDFNTAIMMSVARRIARTQLTDTAAAYADYQQAVSAMTADERAEFDAAIVTFAMEME